MKEILLRGNQHEGYHYGLRSSGSSQCVKLAEDTMVALTAFLNQFVIF